MVMSSSNCRWGPLVLALSHAAVACGNNSSSDVNYSSLPEVVTKSVRDARGSSVDGEVSSAEISASGLSTPIELAAMGRKLLWGTGLVGALAVGILVVIRRWTQSPEDRSTALVLAADLPLNARGRVSLLRVHGQHVLVGHDASGIRAMVLLPEPFTETLRALSDHDTALATPETASGSSPAPDDARGEYRLKLRHLGDSGWDLNRQIS